LTSLQQRKLVVLQADGCWALPSVVTTARPAPKAPHPADPVKSFDDFVTDKDHRAVVAELRSYGRPITAVNLTKRLGKGWNRSTVNSILYKLERGKVVESKITDQMAPLWTIAQRQQQQHQQRQRSLGSDDSDEESYDATPSMADLPNMPQRDLETDDDAFTTELKREGLMASAVASMQPSSSIGGAQKREEEEDEVADLRRQMAAMQQQMNNIAKALSQSNPRRFADHSDDVAASEATQRQ
jgi:hypothetical protein